VVRAAGGGGCLPADPGGGSSISGRATGSVRSRPSLEGDFPATSGNLHALRRKGNVALCFKDSARHAGRVRLAAFPPRKRGPALPPVRGRGEVQAARGGTLRSGLGTVGSPLRSPAPLVSGRAAWQAARNMVQGGPSPLAAGVWRPKLEGGQRDDCPLPAAPAPGRSPFRHAFRGAESGAGHGDETTRENRSLFFCIKINSFNTQFRRGRRVLLCRSRLRLSGRWHLQLL
jgi:hypothetical protein